MKNTEINPEFYLNDETPDKNEDQDRSKFLVKELLETRTLIISQGIDAQLAKSVYSMLILLEKDDHTKPITIIINSPGGSADSGFGIGRGGPHAGNFGQPPGLRVAPSKLFLHHPDQVFRHFGGGGKAEADR